MKSSKRKNKILLLIILLLGISIGFAALSTVLKINGNTLISKNTWKVYWDEDSINVTEGSKESSLPIVSDDTEEDTLLSWSVSLDLPGDFYEFTVDAVNAGTLDAMITDINENINPTLPDYIKYSVTYADGTIPSEKHILPKKKGSTLTRQKYKIRVEVLDTMTREDVANIPDGGVSYTFNYDVQYGQADDTALNFFALASWDDIVDEYENGDPNNLLHNDMNNGTTKDITLVDGTPNGLQAKLRIANLSTPSECSQEGFSKSACGFVLEFTDYLGHYIYNTFDWDYYSTHGYNSRMSEGGHGGWKYSNMRAYLNGGIYNGPEGTTDFAGNAFIDTLPNDLRNKIIDTELVSGHGRLDSSNFITIDKIYLLDPKEIYGTSFTDNYNTAKDYQRQLDYYKDRGVTTTNNKNIAIKKDVVTDQDPWWGWLRSATMQWDANLFVVDINGDANSACSNDIASYSPAFRIAE